MKIFLASVALLIAGTLVFEIHQLTKAVRVQVHLDFRYICRAYIDIPKAAPSSESTRARECASWAASYFPQAQGDEFEEKR